MLALVRLACRPRTPSSGSLAEIVPDDSDEELALDLSSGDEDGDDMECSNLELLLSDDDDPDLKQGLPDIVVLEDSPSPQRPVGLAALHAQAAETPRVPFAKRQRKEPVSSAKDPKPSHPTKPVDARKKKGPKTCPPKSASTRGLRFKARMPASKSPEFKIPSGWRLDVRVRTSGVSAGLRDKYYISPCGKHQLRSLRGVRRWIAGDRGKR